MGHGNGNWIPWIVGGPLLVIVLAAGLAAVVVTVTLIGRMSEFMALGEKALERLSSGRALSVMWGFVATFALYVASGAAVQTRILGLLGVAIFVFANFAVCTGAGVAALALGREVSVALGRVSADDLSALKLGFGLLALASIVPLVGWILVLLAVAAGVGTIITTLASRNI